MTTIERLNNQLKTIQNYYDIARANGSFYALGLGVYDEDPEIRDIFEDEDNLFITEKERQERVFQNLLCSNLLRIHEDSQEVYDELKVDMIGQILKPFLTPEKAQTGLRFVDNLNEEFLNIESLIESNSELELYKQYSDLMTSFRRRFDSQELLCRTLYVQILWLGIDDDDNKLKDAILNAYEKDRYNAIVKILKRLS